MSAAPDLFTQAILPLFEEHRASFLERARAAARRIALVQGELTVDDIRKVCPPPADVDPRVMGAVLKSSEFEAIGYRRSERRINHGRPIAIFRLRAVA